MRARQLGITLGLGTPGPFNAITDVPGVRVGQHPEPADRRQAGSHRRHPGPTARRCGALQPCFAGCHVLNGNGDATGLEWIREAGLLTTPIAITNTHSVGAVRALIAESARRTRRQRAVLVHAGGDGDLRRPAQRYLGPASAPARSARRWPAPSPDRSAKVRWAAVPG